MSRDAIVADRSAGQCFRVNRKVGTTGLSAEKTLDRRSGR